MQLMSGDNVQHYWDGDRRVGAALQELIGTDYPAWDVWLLYPRGVTWGEVPPDPAWWEHHLSSLDDEKPELRLDPERFAARARALIDE